MRLLNKSLSSAWAVGILAITLLYLEFNLGSIAQDLFGIQYGADKVHTLLYFISHTMICFFVIPICVHLFIFQKKSSVIGLKIPIENKLNLFYFLLAFSVFVPLMFYLGKLPAFQRFYGGHLNFPELLVLQIIVFPLYYFSEEFFFRGFLLFNLWQKVKWHSIWITDILFVIAHLGKPFWEVIVAIPAGFVLGFLALRTKSILPAFILHYSMGVTLFLSANNFVNFK